MGAEGGRVAGRAFEDLDGHGAAVGRAEQAIDDLQLALLAVAVVAELGERAAAAFHVARCHIVEHERAAAEMAPGQRRLDRRLADRQPVESAVELLLVDGTEAELGPEAGAGGLRRERARRRELRAGIEDPADGEREDEIPAAVALRSNEPIEADLARRAERRGDMTVRQGTDDADRLLVSRDDRAALQQRLEAGDPLARPVGQVQERALLDLPALAVALAQEDGRGRIAVRDGFDVHGPIIDTTLQLSIHKIQLYMATFSPSRTKLLLKFQSFIM